MMSAKLANDPPGDVNENFWSDKSVRMSIDRFHFVTDFLFTVYDFTGRIKGVTQISTVCRSLHQLKSESTVKGSV